MLLSFWERRLHAPNTFYSWSTTICKILGIFCFFVPFVLADNTLSAHSNSSSSTEISDGLHRRTTIWYVYSFYFISTAVVTFTEPYCWKWVLNSFTTEYVILVAAIPSMCETTMKSECIWWEILLAEKKYIWFLSLSSSSRKDRMLRLTSAMLRPNSRYEMSPGNTSDNQADDAVKNILCLR